MLYDEGKYEDEVRGQRIAVVGPADTLMQFPQGERIDSYNLVARINGHLPLKPELAANYGTRTDILYINAFSRMIGVVSPAKVVCVTEPGRSRGALKHAKGAPFPARLVRRELMPPLIEQLGTKAHTGTVAIRELLDMGAAEVFVAGFTFYSGRGKEPVYVPGYSDKTPMRSRRWARGGRSMIHNAQGEFELFKTWLAEEPRLTMDAGLTALVEGGYVEERRRRGKRR